jgi:hypothetical protein
MLIVDSQIPIWEDTLPPMIHRQVETYSKDDLIAEMATAGVDRVLLHSQGGSSGQRNDFLTDKAAVAKRLREVLAAHKVVQAESMWDWHTTPAVNIDRDNSQPDQAVDTFIY